MLKVAGWMFRVQDCYKRCFVCTQCAVWCTNVRRCVCPCIECMCMRYLPCCAGMTGGLHCFLSPALSWLLNWLWRLLLPQWVHVLMEHHTQLGSYNDSSQSKSSDDKWNGDVLLLWLLVTLNLHIARAPLQLFPWNLEFVFLQSPFVKLC